MSTEPTPTIFLCDPLSEPARKERRNLLASAVIGILIAKAGLIPTEITGLGISLTGDDQQTIVFILTVVIGYFLTAFTLYGLSDFMIFRKSYQDYVEAVENHSDAWTREDQERYEELRRRVGDVSWVYRWAKPAAVARAVFEFMLPLMVGVYAIVALALQ